MKIFSFIALKENFYHIIDYLLKLLSLNSLNSNMFPIWKYAQINYATSYMYDIEKM